MQSAGYGKQKKDCWWWVNAERIGCAQGVLLNIEPVTVMTYEGLGRETSASPVPTPKAMSPEAHTWTMERNIFVYSSYAGMTAVTIEVVISRCPSLAFDRTCLLIGLSI